MDGELREVLEQYAGYCIWAAQDVTEGGSGGLESLRQDLYKKICSADSIACRPPYARRQNGVSQRNGAV